MEGGASLGLENSIPGDFPVCILIDCLTEGPKSVFVRIGAI